MADEKEKSERLAAALRANLLRRKAQARARREEPAPASPAPGPDLPQAGPGSVPAGPPMPQGQGDGGAPDAEVSARGSGAPAASGAPRIVPEGEAG
ncbi:hypothetical protein ACI7BZ_20210 [Xanthobacter sp. AM11]|uniref:hypothetical protein n=1 Tax=Xanthobacter sp. AM11 TaxID=3380643 RepID=UPI0039BFE551